QQTGKPVVEAREISKTIEIAGGDEIVRNEAASPNGATMDSLYQYTANPAQFLNRELSLLDFHARVLDEAIDSRNPLLERARFLGIFSNNLDEFLMIRVAGI